MSSTYTIPPPSPPPPATHDEKGMPPLNRDATVVSLPPPPDPVMAVFVGDELKEVDDRTPNFKRVVDTRHGQIRLVRMLDPEKKEEDDNSPNYQRVVDRTPFLVKIDSNGLMSRGGKPLDTKTIMDSFFKSEQAKDLGMVGLGHRNRGDHRAFEVANAPYNEWCGSMIWVCAPDKETGDACFYTHVCLVQQFHHSSFTQGDVIGAGSWIVRDGRLTKINALSGHYRPSIHCLFRSILHLAPAFKGLVPEPMVWLYDAEQDDYVDYPIRSFIASPTTRVVVEPLPSLKSKRVGNWHQLRVHPQSLT